MNIKSVVKVQTIKTYCRSFYVETNKKNVATVHRFNCEYRWFCCVLFIVSIRRRVISQSLLYLQQKERYTSKLYIGANTIEQLIKRKRKETSPHGSKSFSCVAYKLITLKENSLQYSSLSQRPLGDLKAKHGTYDFFFFYLVFLSRLPVTRIIQLFRQKLLTERKR